MPTLPDDDGEHAPFFRVKKKLNDLLSGEYVFSSPLLDAMDGFLLEAIAELMEDVSDAYSEHTRLLREQNELLKKIIKEQVEWRRQENRRNKRS